MQAGQDRVMTVAPGGSPLAARLHDQRARGGVRLSMATSGIRTLREEGSLKIRLPSGTSQAILINTAGGIAGGDHYAIEVEATGESRLSVSSQAAERVYRTLGPMARVNVTHRVRDRARLVWLPQETILFESSGLSRSLDVEIDGTASFLGMESTVLGRRESGEVLQHIAFREHWSVRRDGKLLQSERLAIDGALPRGTAELGNAGAFATLLLVAPDAEARIEDCRARLGERSGVSAWDGRLVVRLLEEDGFRLRKRLLHLLPVLLSAADIPRVWLI